MDLLLNTIDKRFKPDTTESPCNKLDCLLVHTLRKALSAECGEPGPRICWQSGATLVSYYKKR